jgi:hypothetical protein
MDAPTFTDSEKRGQAELIVTQALLDHPCDALDSYTKDHAEFNMVYNRISEMVRRNRFLMSVLITNCLKMKEAEIQAALEAE